MLARLWCAVFGHQWIHDQTVEIASLGSLLFDYCGRCYNTRPSQRMDSVEYLPLIWVLMPTALIIVVLIWIGVTYGG